MKRLKAIIEYIAFLPVRVVVNLLIRLFKLP